MTWRGWAAWDDERMGRRLGEVMSLTDFAEFVKVFCCSSSAPPVCASQRGPCRFCARCRCSQAVDCDPVFLALRVSETALHERIHVVPRFVLSLASHSTKQSKHKKYMDESATPTVLCTQTTRFTTWLISADENEGGLTWPRLSWCRRETTRDQIDFY